MSSSSIQIDDYLESDDSGDVANTISLGEDDNTSEALHQIVTDNDNACRLMDVQTALEDLVAIADSIDNATEKDVLLVNTAIQAALAGTDIRPDEVQPGLESFIGTRISTEGIGSFIKSIWDAIVGLLKRIWSMISKFFSGLFGRAKRTEKKANALVEKFEAKMTAKAKTSTFTLGDEANKLIRKGGAPRNAKDIEAGLSANLELLQDTEKFIQAVNGVSSRLVQAINAFNPDDHVASVERVIEAISEICTKHTGLMLTPITGDQRYIDGAFGGYQVFGNKRVVAKLPLTRNDPTYSNFLIKLGAAKGTSFVVEEVRPGIKDFAGANFPTLTPSEGVKLANNVSTLTTMVSNFSSKYKNLSLDSKEIKDIMKASDKLTSLMESRQSNNENTSAEVTTAYKSVVQVSVTYSQWLTKFVAQVMNQIEVSNQAVIALLEKSHKNLE